jgi:hypothetical protein
MKLSLFSLVICFSVFSNASPPTPVEAKDLKPFLGVYQVTACIKCGNFAPLKGEVFEFNKDSFSNGTTLNVSNTALKFKSLKDGYTDKIKIEKSGDHFIIYREVSRISLFGSPVSINYVILANHPSF